MREGWVTKTLGEIADVKGGKRVPKGYKLQSEPTQYPYITVSDFSDDGTIDMSNLRYVSGAVFEQIKRYTISSNDLYLSIAGTIGKTGRVPHELDGASLTENACKLVLHPGISRDFIYYFTKTDDFTRQAGINTRTAAQPKLALERLKTIRLSIPLSLSEQQRIADILDEAFDRITTAKASAEKNLQNARDLFENYLHVIFTQRGEGWVERPLADICEVKDGTHDSPTYVSEGVPFVTQKNIREDGLSLDDTRFITQTDHDKFYKRSNVSYGDILISMIGANRGMACIVDNTTLFSIKNVGLVKRNNSINRYFLLYFLKSSMAADYVRSNSKGGAQEFIGLTELRKFPILTPSLQEQESIVTKLDALAEQTQRLESIYQQKLAALDELKKSLLQRAFSGELTAD